MIEQKRNFWVLADLKVSPFKLNSDLKKDDLIVAIGPIKNQVASVRIANINPKLANPKSKLKQQLIPHALLNLRDGKKAINNEKAVKKIQEIIAKNQNEKTIKITELEFNEIMG